jgi:hypothetical protein
MRLRSIRQFLFGIQATDLLTLVKNQEENSATKQLNARATLSVAALLSTYSVE